MSKGERIALTIAPPKDCRLAVACWLAAFAAGLALYAPELRAFFLGDELPTMAQSAPWLGKTWLSPFAPIDNGFLRIPMLMTFHLLLRTAGPSPLAFHLTCVALLAGVAALTGLLARRLTGSAAAAPVAALLTMGHIGGWGAGIMLCNSGDVYLAGAILGGLLAWDSWLERGGGGRLAVVAGGLALTLFSKETGIVYPVYLVLWALGRGRLDRRARGWLTGLAGLALLYAAGAVARQMGAPTSYLSGERMDFSLLRFGRRFLDYAVSVFIPYLHVMEWPVRHFALPGWALWTVRLLTLGGVVWAGERLARGGRGRWSAVLLFCAWTGLPMACLLGQSPQIRFLSCSVPFAALLAVTLIWQSRGRARRVVVSAVAALWVLYAAGFYTSPAVARYRRDAAAVERFTGEARRLAPGWPRGATVAVYDHPIPEQGPWRWVYAQLIFDLFIPEAQARLALDQAPPGAARVYRFDGERLIETARE